MKLISRVLTVYISCFWRFLRPSRAIASSLALAVCGLWVLVAGGVAAAGGVTETVAGTGKKGYSGDGGLATRAEVNNPFGVVRGPEGALYFCEYDNHLIRRIAPDGTISTVAGSGRRGYAGDGGPAVRAELNLPHEIRFDRQGNLFIADMGNHCVRRVDATTRVMSTVAGVGKAGYSGDGGPADAAALNQPHSLQFDRSGDLYICDIGNHVVRKIHPPTGMISTFAGTGKPGPTPEGAPLAGTPLHGPRTLDFDQAGNLWLALREGNQVFKIDLQRGRYEHVAGTGKKGFTGNGGPARAATLSGPKGICVAPNGNVYLADTESHSIRMIDRATGRIELVAGTGEPGDGPDGDALQCKLARPHGIFMDADGSLLIGDSEAHRVRRLRLGRPNGASRSP